MNECWSIGTIDGGYHVRTYAIGKYSRSLYEGTLAIKCEINPSTCIHFQGAHNVLPWYISR